jgi:hypothetical protein
MSALKVLLGAAAAATLMMASAAQAAVLVYDDFEGYNNATILNFTAFNDLTVVGGTVDLIGTPNVHQLQTGYDSGFVDLDGSTNNGGALYTDVFSFAAGARVTLEFELAGNQRGGTDDWNYGFETAGGNITFLDVDILNAPTSGLHSFPGLFGSGPALSSGIGVLASNAPWTHYSIAFTAGNAGSLRAFAGTSSADNIGPLIDNFSFSASVPEPTTWLMMIMGFGGIGAILRRRTGAAFA